MNKAETSQMHKTNIVGSKKLCHMCLQLLRLIKISDKISGDFFMISAATCSTCTDFVFPKTTCVTKFAFFKNQIACHRSISDWYSRKLQHRKSITRIQLLTLEKARLDCGPICEGNVGKCTEVQGSPLVACKMLWICFFWCNSLCTADPTQPGSQ